MNVWRSGAAAFAVSCVVCFTACTQAPPPPLPHGLDLKTLRARQVAARDPILNIYSKAPGPLREFLLKARAAEEIADPLQRCLGFPVLPGTKWPKGLIESHCEYAHGPRPSEKEVVAHIDAGDVAWLEQTYRTWLDRHFSETNFSEHIHDLFDYFGGDYESGRLTQRWLQLAPDSPFALTARAQFYMGLGWEARGKWVISQTPPEQIAQMEAHHAKAIEFFQQAIAKEPRMLPAYAGLVELGRNDKDLGDSAFEAGRRIDPACKVLMSSRMHMLLPRWGGSYAQMFALEQQMLPYMEKRPLLALSRAWPYIDMADELRQEKKYDDAVAALQPMVAITSNPELQEDLGSVLMRADRSDKWQALAYLVAAKRFRPGRAQVATDRAWLEISVVHDYELAIRELAYSAQLEPERKATHIYYGYALTELRRLDEAEREYLLAMQYDPEKGETYRDALIALVDSELWRLDRHKALSYSERAVKEFPNYWPARSLHAFALERTGASPAEQRATIEQWLRDVNRKDPARQEEIEKAESALRDIDAAEKKNR